MAGNEEDFEIHGSFDDAISGPAGRASESLDDLEDSALTAAAAERELERETAKANRELNEQTRAAKRAERALDQHARAAKQSRDELGRFTAEEENATKKMGNFLKKGVTFSRFFKVLKPLAVADGLNFVATGIAGVGAAGVAAVAGLAPLTGMVVAYPGLLAAAGQGLLTFKLGVKGVGEAIKVLADPKASPEALAEALKDLTPEARKFAVEVASLAKNGKSLRQNIQEKLFAGLSKEVAPLAKTYFPILNQQLGDTGHSLNLVAKYTADWLKQRQNVQAVNTLLGQQDILVRNLGMSTSDFGRFFLWLLKSAQPMLQELTKDIADGSAALANITQRNEGKLSAFFLRSYTLAKQVTGVLVDIFKGFYNIGKASLGLAGDMGKGVHDIAQNFREWTESEAGQKKLRDFFTFMKPVVWELAYLIRDLGKGLGSIAMSPNFVSTMQTFRTEILPMIFQFIQASDGKFIPSILQIVQALGSLGQSLNVIGPISEILQVMAQALTWFAAQVAQLSPQQQQWLGWAITIGLFAAKWAVFVNIAKFAWMALTKIWTIAKLVFMAFRLIGAFFLANPIVAAIVIIIVVLVLLWKKNEAFRNFVIAAWHAIATAAIAVWNWIKNAALQFWSWIGPVVMGFVQLIIAYFKMVWAWWKFLWSVAKLILTVALIAIVLFVRQKIAEFKAIFNIISTLWSAVWNKIKPIVMPILKWIVDTVKQRIDGMGKTIAAIGGFFKTAFEKARDFVMPIIDAIKGAIEKVTGAISTVTSGVQNIQSGASGILDRVLPGRFAGGDVQPGKSYMTGELGPEAVVSRTGNVKMIGMSGPEVLKSTNSGYVIPNHVLNGAEDRSVPGWAIDRLRGHHQASRATEGAQKTAQPRSEARSPKEWGDDRPYFDFRGSHFTSNVDVKTSIKEAMDEYDRDKRERQ